MVSATFGEHRSYQTWPGKRNPFSERVPATTTKACEAHREPPSPETEYVFRVAWLRKAENPRHAEQIRVSGPGQGERCVSGRSHRRAVTVGSAGRGANWNSGTEAAMKLLIRSKVASS